MSPKNCKSSSKKCPKVPCKKCSTRAKLFNKELDQQKRENKEIIYRIACESCRASKIKCSGMLPCQRCIQKNECCNCNYQPKKSSYRTIRDSFRSVFDNQPKLKKQCVNEQQLDNDANARFNIFKQEYEKKNLEEENERLKQELTNYEKKNLEQEI